MHDSAFWTFSLAFYAGPGVPEACLRLQDECGVDVNVMLYALYAARMGRRLRQSDAARIDAYAAPWRDGVVRALRSVRRLLKTPPEGFVDAGTAALRTDVKRIELEAERLQQLALERDLPAQGLGEAHGDPTACARHNLSAYAEHIGGFPQDPVEVLLRRFHDT